MDRERFVLALDPPLATAAGPIREREGFLLTVDHAGMTGLGESTPLAGWTESLQTCREALDRAAAVAAALDWGVALGKTAVPAARHGLSLALAEARARAADDPLYRSLGGNRHVERVAVNATVGADTSPAETAERARMAQDAGFPCLKVKVGTRSVEDDVERVRAVRDAVDELGVRVDANGAWTVDQADRAVDALAALAVDYVEQPLPRDRLAATGDLRGRGVDIALDESLAAHAVTDVLDADAADVLVLKPMVLGGPDVAVAAAADCRAAGVDPVVSTTVDGVVARTAAVHVAATIPDVRPCGLATADRIVEDLAPDPAPVSDGAIAVPQAAGLGLGERP